MSKATSKETGKAMVKARRKETMKERGQGTKNARRHENANQSTKRIAPSISQRTDKGTARGQPRLIVNAITHHSA